MNPPDPTSHPPGAPIPAGPGHSDTTRSKPTTSLFGNPIGQQPPNAPNSSSLDPRDSATPPSPASTTTTVQNYNSNDTTDIERWRKLFYNTSLGVVIAGPILAFMPPRKLDLFTFALGTAWCMSAGYVIEQKTGQGLLWHIGSRIPSEGNRRRIEEERRRRLGLDSDSSDNGLNDGGRSKGGLAQQAGERGMLKRIWMAGESDDWVQERARKEREALEEGGKGYGGLIMDSVREVFGYKNKEEEEEE